jgi:cupin fold WbuC family metalloprotein
MTHKPFPRALNAPPGEAVVLNAGLLERAVAASRKSPRRRVILPLHRSAADPYQRMLNAVQPGSYIRPHRHRDPPKGETVVVLRGVVRFLTFRANGAVARNVVLTAHGGAIGLDVRPGVYHTFIALEPDSVVFEAKTGPYDERVDKDFAPWAPPEGSPEAAQYMERLAG